MIPQIFHKFSTDRPTDQPTFALIEDSCWSLKIKTIKEFDFYDYLIIFSFAFYLSLYSIPLTPPQPTPSPTEHPLSKQFQKRIKKFLQTDWSTDQPTDRPTFALIEAPCKSIKIKINKKKHQRILFFGLFYYLVVFACDCSHLGPF